MKPQPCPCEGQTVRGEGIFLEEVEAALLHQALTQAGGNQTRTAEILSLTRDQFRYRLKKLRQTNGIN